jgi:hypothetical protein
LEVHLSQTGEEMLLIKFQEKEATKKCYPKDSKCISKKKSIFS